MTVTIRAGDCREVLRTLPDESVHCCVTSPPYFGLRDYGVAEQIGLEPTPDAFVAEMVAVFGEVRRVLRDDGTLWLNLGDSYANDGKWGGSTSGKHVTALHGDTGAGRGKRTTGLKPKDLIGIPWRVAFALQADGWYLRQDIIWSKPNPMPESVTDRCTKAHEYIFLMSKSARYHYDAAAIKEPGTDRPPGNHGHKYTTAYESSGTEHHRTTAGLERMRDGYETRNKRTVWEVGTQPFSEAHFATFPPALIEPCIKAGCPAGGTVLDPFGGAGTTGMVADRLGRDAILIEINPEYAAMAERRIRGDAGMFAEVTA
jgi:DNA modification methylase